MKNQIQRYSRNTLPLFTFLAGVLLLISFSVQPDVLAQEEGNQDAGQSEQNSGQSEEQATSDEGDSDSDGSQYGIRWRRRFENGMKKIRQAREQRLQIEKTQNKILSTFKDVTDKLKKYNEKDPESITTEDKKQVKSLYRRTINTLTEVYSRGRGLVGAIKQEINVTRSVLQDMKQKALEEAAPSDSEDGVPGSEYEQRLNEDLDDLAYIIHNTDLPKQFKVPFKKAFVTGSQMLKRLKKNRNQIGGTVKQVRQKLSRFLQNLLASKYILLFNTEKKLNMIAQEIQRYRAGSQVLDIAIGLGELKGQIKKWKKEANAILQSAGKEGDLTTNLGNVKNPSNLPLDILKDTAAEILDTDIGGNVITQEEPELDKNLEKELQERAQREAIERGQASE